MYEVLPGWDGDITRVTRWTDLPVEARDYVEFMGKQVGVPVTIVSVGPERRQTIIR